MNMTLTTTRNGSRRQTGRSDEDLIKACLDGEQDAWNELVDRYGRLVYSVSRRYGLSEADSRDVFQDVFTILYRKLCTVRDRGRLSSWLIRTTYRACYRVGKASGRYASLHESLPSDGPASDVQAASVERQQMVRQALRQLGGRGEQLLTALFSGPGRPNYQAIARQLGMKVGSIGPARARCLKKLERIFKEMAGARAPSPSQRAVLAGHQ